ncbi:MAG: condensation domain-containing protein, partial [Chitinophagaceae bacterium]
HEAPKGVSVPVGKPVQNMRIYIVDKAGNNCPVGVSGEIQVTGIGVGRGYWKDEEKTNRSFIKLGEERLYRTGDLGRWLPDGNIEYLGRMDEQVKIRGYRIELGEIETVLQQSSGIRQCVVIAKEDKQGIKRLVAYVVTEDAFAKEEVIAYLKNKLPEYMVPGVFMQLESIPLSANGKIDRKRLPDVEASSSVVAYQAPRNVIEEKLVNIWQSLIDVKRIGVHDNFFELGGHSLLIMRMVSFIRKQLEKEVTIRTVFDHPTIAGLAEVIKGDEQADLTPFVQRYERTEKIPLSFAQERLWFVDRLHGSVQYHIPWVLRLSGNLNVSALEDSLRTIVNRHEVLRTVISEEGGRGYQHINELDQWNLQYIQRADILANGDSLESYIEEYVLHPYDLVKGPMFRLTLIRLSENEHVLVAVMHHIAFDAWSVGILVQELVELYRSAMENREPVLKELPVQYADYAIWQRNYLSGAVLENKLQYWKNQLQDVRPLELITDYPRPATQSIEGGIVYKTISSELRNELLALTQREGVTMFMGLLSVYKILLHRYTSQDDICVGIPIAGRQQEELEGLIGFFINALALRTDLGANPSFREVLQRVKQTTVGAYEHQEVPFEKVVEALEVERDMSRNPIFQVKFALQNAPEAGVLDLRGVELSVGGYDKVKAQIDISLDVFESEEGLGLNLTYCSDLYRADTMQGLLDHYEHILKAVIKNIDRPVAELPILSLKEEKQLLEEFN